LRYLSDVYKALVQNVPNPDKTDAIDDIITYFGAIVRQVDSSLLDEWQRMRDRSWTGPIEAPSLQLPEPHDITRDRRGFTVLVRNELFLLLRALSAKDYEAAAQMVEPGGELWPPSRFEQALSGYYEEHGAIRIDPKARSPNNTLIRESDAIWEVTQILCDPEDDNDWMLQCAIDLDSSRAAGRPILTLQRVGT
jgi:hypothetical protein